MQSSTARKIEQHTDTTHSTAEIIDLGAARKIAQASEAACHLPGNTEACDFEEFMLKYDMKLTGDFE